MNIRTFNRQLDQSRAEADRTFAAFNRAYLRLIRAAGRDAAENLLAQTHMTAAAWQPPPEGNLLNIAELGLLAQERIGKLQRRTLKVVAGVPLARAGISWDITHPLSQQLLANAAQRTGERLGTGVQLTLRNTVAEAYADGLSVIQAADLIRERIVDAAPAQAEMLARTDLNGLANGGSVMAAKIAGVEYKQWLTAEDDLVRPDHAAADGQTVPIDQPFDIGGEPLDFPGDPAGSDAEVCNCRCTVIYTEGPAGIDSGGSETLVESSPREGYVAAKSQGPSGIPSIAEWEQRGSISAEPLRPSVIEQGDPIFHDIAVDQGFTGLPTVVTDSEMDALVEGGSRELFRGVTELKYADQFRTGEFYAGQGTYGSGTYVAYDAAPLGSETIYPGLRVASGYAESGTIMRMTLRPEAKVITWEDAAKGAIAERKAGSDAWKVYASDVGRWAAAQGFDVIEGGDHARGTMVILNRTAVRVSERNAVDPIVIPPRPLQEPKP